jgi:hypothetical protein
MEVNNIYYQKYLKYKSKYIELKKLIGGAIRCKGKDNRGCLRECKKFITPKNNGSSNKEYLDFCDFCTHNKYWHQKV